MLDSLLVNGNRSRHPHRIHFIHVARNSAEMPFTEHLHSKAASHANLHLHIAFSSPLPQDRLGTSHHSAGRLDIETLKGLLPLDDYDFYLCGPSGFMQAMYDGLRAIGIGDERIRAETFGPAALRRNVNGKTTEHHQAAVEVSFRQSGKQAEWRGGSLLELAEANGIAALSSCRQGICGTCATQLASGQVEYASPPVADLQPGEVLLCCARPQPGSSKIELAL
jgi:ferredoxin-NADP reductase